MIGSNKSRSGRSRALCVEPLESRRMLAADFRMIALDTNADGEISPIDAALVINDLNARAATGATAGVLRRLDVNGDGEMSAVDAALVINRLNLNGSGPIRLAQVLGSRADQVVQVHQECLDQLMQDLNGLRRNSNLAPQDVADLVDSFADVLENAVPPDPVLVDKLVDDFTQASADGSFSLFELLQLSNDVNSVLTSAGLTQAQIQQITADVGAVVTASGITSNDLQVIIADVREILDCLSKPVASAAGSPGAASFVGQVLAVSVERDLSSSQLNDRIELLQQTADDALSLRVNRPAIETLVNDAREALADHHLSAEEQSTLADDLSDIFADTNIPRSFWERILEDVAQTLDAWTNLRGRLQSFAHRVQNWVDGIFGRRLRPDP